MSRIGKQPIPMPDAVKVAVNARSVQVEGPKGKLNWEVPVGIRVDVDAAEKMIKVARADDTRQQKAFHGLSRALIANMVKGVAEGYEQKMEVFGAGYGVKLQGKELSLTVGTATPAKLTVPSGVEVNIETPNARGNDEPARLTLTGPDKQQLFEFAARIKRVRPPEPYHGKGIRYAGEHVRRKVGKAFSSGGAA